MWEKLAVLFFAAIVSVSADAVEFSIPAGWQSVKDLFGIPLTIIGPRHEDASPVIVFSDSGIDGLKFDETALGRNEREYRDGREKWLATRAGRSIRYFGYRREVWPSGLEAHHVGYEYALLYTAFVEDSYFVLCENRLYHVKTLVRAAWGEEIRREVTTIAQSFACRKGGVR